LASGERPDGAAASVAEPELTQQLVHARPGHARGEVPQPRREAKVLFRGEVAIQGRVLKDEPDAAPNGEPIVADVVPRHTRRAARRL
jgi:hypothetical protein